MKIGKIKLMKTMLYISCFVVGTAIFWHMANSVRIPIYETRQGMVKFIEGEVFIEMGNGCDGELPDKIYYYINRDEWVERESVYDKEKGAFRINNIHKLKDKTRVMIDVEVGQLTLFEVIFTKGGNV